MNWIILDLLSALCHLSDARELTAAAAPFDPDRAIDCPDALSLPFVTEFWWRWLLPYFPRLQNSTTHLCPLGVVHLALITRSVVEGGGGYVCRRLRSVPPQTTDHLLALFSLLLLLLPHFFPPLTFDKLFIFTSFPTTLLITRSPRSTDYLPTLLRLPSFSLSYFSP